MKRLSNFKKLGDSLKKNWPLILIVVVGGFFRFYNLNWDRGYSFHPDEPNISVPVTAIRFFTQLNPPRLIYGGLPVYLYRAAGEFLSFLTNDSSWTTKWGQINLIGRFFSATASFSTIIYVYILGKRLFGKKVGYWTAFFTAFAVSLIQTAHFAVTESYLALWVVLISLLGLTVLKNPILKNYTKLGVVCGLALATKFSAASFLTIPLVSQIVLVGRNFRETKNLTLKFTLFLAAAFLVFFICSPYTILDFSHFRQSMNYEGGLVTGRIKVFYTYQFFNTFPYVFQFKNLFWQLGPSIPVFALIGGFYLLFLTLKNRSQKLLILLSFFLVYFLIIGSWFTKFIRYMVPLVPLLSLFAAKLLIDFKEKFKSGGKILLGVVAVSTFLYSLAFMSIYFQENSRISALRWIKANIPQGAKILTEHWDNELHIAINTDRPNFYRMEALSIYNSDTQTKIDYYAEKLGEADYMVFNSRRLYGTLMYLPEKYPITSHYYKLLFGEKLGYTKIVQFTSYPSLFGIEINDDKSEETFQVFDHPKVLIFKNTKRLSVNELKRLLLYD